jgi:Protein of unknown function (DUF4199)
MKRFVLKFGLISGLILVAISAITVPLHLSGKIGMTKAMWLGFTVMTVSFIPVFLGVRAYREEHGGVISFGRAFGLGMLIALVSTLCYVTAWEIVYFGGLLPGFEERMKAEQLADLQKKGASAEEIAQMHRRWELYKNPAINAGITLLEPLPVALIVSFVAAGILRRKPGEGGSPAAAMA